MLNILLHTSQQKCRLNKDNIQAARRKFVCEFDIFLYKIAGALLTLHF